MKCSSRAAGSSSTICRLHVALHLRLAPNAVRHQRPDIVVMRANGVCRLASHRRAPGVSPSRSQAGLRCSRSLAKLNDNRRMQGLLRRGDRVRCREKQQPKNDKGSSPRTDAPSIFAQPPFSHVLRLLPHVKLVHGCPHSHPPLGVYQKYNFPNRRDRYSHPIHMFSLFPRVQETEAIFRTRVLIIRHMSTMDNGQSSHRHHHEIRRA